MFTSNPAQINIYCRLTLPILVMSQSVILVSRPELSNTDAYSDELFYVADYKSGPHPDKSWLALLSVKTVVIFPFAEYCTIAL